MDNRYVSPYIVDGYEKYVPEWPKIVPETILEFLAKNNPDAKSYVDGTEKVYERMIDAGCGGGKSTRVFAKYFRTITGFDISCEMIDKARVIGGHDNISYAVGNEDLFPAGDETVDLIISSFAVHHMDLGKFISESKRVLKSTGCVALLGYECKDIEYCPPAQAPSNLSSGIEVFDRYYIQPLRKSLRDVDHPDQSIHDRYQALYNGVRDMEKSRNDSVKFKYSCTLHELKHVYRSVPCYDFFHKSCEADVLGSMGEKLKELWNIPDKDDSDIELEVTVSVFMVFLWKKS